MYFLVFVSILHYLLYNYIKIGGIFLANKSNKKKYSRKEPEKMNEILVGNIVEDEEEKQKEIEVREEVKDREESKKKNNKDRKDSSKDKEFRKRKPNLLIILTFLVLIGGLGYFILSLFNFSSLGDVINGLLVLGISLFFVAVCFTNPSKRRTTSYLALGSLFIYQVLGCLVGLGSVTWPTNNTVGNFVGKSMTDAIEWATANGITLNQEYEYSDMIPEYHVINQDVAVGTKVKSIKSLTIAISEGASPYKEVVIPNMIGWDTERVLEFIEKNYLTNVLVDFVQGNENENTLIDQSISGNVQRNEEIKLVFSFGDERHYSEVKLIDLSDKSQFQAEFYLKQYGIQYEINYDFSDKVKRGNVISQSIKAGEIVSISGEDATVVVITISKGAKITVPDLKKMNVSEITNWVIKNKLKIEFKDRYDDATKENDVLDANYNKGDVIEEGTLITITLSKGKLTMQKFNSYTEFREWADGYGILYEEQHEFSDTVDAGEVIKYSYNVGDTIKNKDVVIVTLSDGKKVEVPNVRGLTKTEATNKLNNAGLGYSFVYKYSNDVDKGKAISQSISSGSVVSKGTTVTVTLSNGPKPSSEDSGGNTGEGSGGNTNPPTPVCTPKTYTIGRDLNNIFANYSGFDSVSSQLYSFFASNYPEVKISVVGVDGGDATSGSYIGGIGPGSEITSCNSSPYTIQIAK